MRFRRCLGVFALVLATLSLGLAPASASPDGPVTAFDDQYYEIRSQLTGRCLDVRGAGNGDGVPVDVYNCWGGANQKWRLFPVGGGFYEIHPLNSQRCLDIAGPGGDLGAPAMQWACWGGSKQHWRFVNAGNGYYEIRNRFIDRCLDIAGSGLDNPAPAMVWDCWGGAKQHWLLAPVAA
ncbi:RICIN domain-containing protein [Umezawaea sp. NPDC059074]|uniref:RICIN domain-containing protein n=1 Tax=Umezawaea sp. NPDC059074 TaxID=3346716 RepID=UPI0036B33E7F